jgi:hypothetical protein
LKYHINPATGEPRVCNATVRACRYGGSEDHFESKDDARAAYEEKHAQASVLRGTPKLLDGPRGDRLFPTMAERVKNPPKLRSELTSNPNRSVSCTECGRRIGDALTALDFQEVGMTAGCVHCGNEMDTIYGGQYPIVDPNPDSPTYGATVKENIPKMLWYHWTRREDWHETAFGENGPGRIHLGSERASADRSISYSGGGDGFLYVVEVTPEVTVDDDIHQEQTNDFIVEDTNESGAVRYLNRFEDSGSISLAIKPQFVKIIGYRKTTHDDINAMSTYYMGQDIDKLRKELEAEKA